LANRWTVLVVDDEESVRAWLRIELELRGMACLEAASGHEALALFHESPPDIVLMDQRMPGISGIEAIEQLRSRGFDGPTVLFSAQLAPSLAADARRLGAIPISKLARNELFRVITTHAGLAT
jgi:two-component system response regulator AtoC